MCCLLLFSISLRIPILESGSVRPRLVARDFPDLCRVNGTEGSFCGHVWACRFLALENDMVLRSIKTKHKILLTWFNCFCGDELHFCNPNAKLDPDFGKTHNYVYHYCPCRCYHKTECQRSVVANVNVSQAVNVVWWQSSFVMEPWNRRYNTDCQYQCDHCHEIVVVVAEVVYVLLFWWWR